MLNIIIDSLANNFGLLITLIGLISTPAIFTRLAH